MDIIRQFCQDLRLTNQVTSLPQLEADLRRVYSQHGLVDPTASASRFRIFSVLLLSGGDTLGYTNTDMVTLQGYHEKVMAELPNVLHTESLVGMTLFRNADSLRHACKHSQSWHSSSSTIPAEEVCGRSLA